MEEKELGGKNEPATSPRHRKGNLFADDGKKEKGGGRSSVNVSMKRIEFRKILSDARLGLGHMRHRIGEVAESVKNAAGSQASKMLVRTRDGQALTTSDEILPSLSHLWSSKSILDTPVAKDLPRLARRVQIVGANDEDVLWTAPTPDNEHKSGSEFSLFLSSEIILHILQYVDPELYSTLGEKLRTETFPPIIKQAESEGTELEPLVVQMIESLGQCNTVKVLKTINQDFVGHCAYELKLHITTNFLTKDVRTAEGWRIIVKIVKDEEVMVTHTRREQSVDMPGQERNHWEFEWSIKMKFDYGMKEMNFADLRVTDLFLSPSMDVDLEKKVKSELTGGVLQ